MSGLKEGDPNGNKQTEPARCCVELLSKRLRLLLNRNRLRGGHKAFSARRENEVFGLNRPMPYPDCRIVGFTQSCVDGSLTFEVGSDQEFPLSSCFTSSSAELIKIW